MVSHLIFSDLSSFSEIQRELLLQFASSSLLVFLPPALTSVSAIWRCMVPKCSLNAG
ncbi:hypothetical protein LINGRAPRIM_LOCUS1853 [Linum grandiflorum]